MMLSRLSLWFFTYATISFSRPLNPPTPTLPSPNTALAPPSPNATTPLSVWPPIPFYQHVTQDLHLQIHLLFRPITVSLAQETKILSDISAITSDVDSGATLIDSRDPLWFFEKGLVEIELEQNLPLPRGQAPLGKVQVEEILHTVWALVYLYGARSFAAKVYNGDVLVGEFDVGIHLTG